MVRDTLSRSGQIKFWPNLDKYKWPNLRNTGWISCNTLYKFYSHPVQWDSLHLYYVLAPQQISPISHLQISNLKIVGGLEEILYGSWCWAFKILEILRMSWLETCVSYTEFSKYTNKNLQIGAVHILRQPPEGGEGVWQMLTIADEGGMGGQLKADHCWRGGELRTLW